MKTRLFLLLGIACALLACKNEEQVMSSSVQEQGRIIATIGCYQDESNKKESPYYKGCVIETADKDTFLTFNFEQDLVSVSYGVQVVSVNIPFAFTHTILSKDDDHYISFDLPIQNTMLQGFPKPIDEVQQALVTMKKE